MFMAKVFISMGPVQTTGVKAAEAKLTKPPKILVQLLARVIVSGLPDEPPILRTLAKLPIELFRHMGPVPKELSLLKSVNVALELIDVPPLYVLLPKSSIVPPPVGICTPPVPIIGAFMVTVPPPEKNPWVGNPAVRLALGIMLKLPPPEAAMKTCPAPPNNPAMASELLQVTV
jgi:hypothetical protein